MPAKLGRAAPGTKTCPSCGAKLAGPYCSQCGEHAVEPEALTLRHFLIHTVAHELLHIEGALWRTMRLLFLRPGQLSVEYAEGRRRPYLNPFRLLLIAIVAYALMTSSGFNVFWKIGPVTTSIAPANVQRGLSVEDTIGQIDHYGLLRSQLATKQDRLQSGSARDRFHERLAAFAQPLSFANVIMLAVALHLVFWQKKRRALEASAFSMHIVSFVLLSSVSLVLAFRLRGLLGSYLYAVIILVGLWQFAYVAISLRRFYLPEGRWGARLLSVLAAVLIYVLNTVFMAAVQIAGASIALALA